MAMSASRASKRSRRRFLAAAIGAGALAALAACQSGPAPTPAGGAGAVATGDQPRGGTLTVALGADSTWLGDPHQSTASVDRHFHYSIFNSLVELGENSAIRPGLAKSWERPDPQTYVFTLEDGVKFHDGTPFDAEIAKWNFERMLSPEPKLIRRSEISSIDQMEVVDRLTLKLKLKRPDAALLSTLTDRAGMMISPAAAKKFSLQDLLRNPVGTGPFRFVEWLEDDRIKLVRNPEYFRKGLPYLDEVVFKPIPDDTVRLANLRSGAVQLMEGVSPRDVGSLRDDASLRLLLSPSLAFDRLELNGAKPPFNNPILRQVVSAAIDRESLHRVAYLGQGTIAQGPISPATAWAYEAIPGWGEKANPELARKLLQDAGQPDGFEFEIDVDSTSKIDLQRAELVEQQLKQVGVRLKIFQYKGAVGAERRSSGTYVSRVGGWSGRPDPHTTLFPHYTTGGANNWGKYSNKEVDDLLTRANVESDQPKRKQLYTEASKILASTVAEVFHEFGTLRTAHSTRLQSFVEIPDGRFRLEKVALAK
jgi:peptide/nickel transport system substrate-binding protein